MYNYIYTALLKHETIMQHVVFKLRTNEQINTDRSLPRQNIAFSFLTQSKKGAVTTFENR